MSSERFRKLFENINLGGAILTTVASVGTVAAFVLEMPLFWVLLIFTAYIFGEFLLIVGTVGTKKVRFNPINVTALLGLYILISLWDFIAVLLGLPFIAITLVLGPAMTVVLFLSSLLLGIYFIEEVIGYDIEGTVSLIKNPLEVLVLAFLLVVSLLALYWHYGRHESADWVLEKARDWIFGLRQKLQFAVDGIVEKYGVGRDSCPEG